MTHLFKRPGLRLWGNMAPGTYTVKSEAKIGTTLLDTSTTTFTVAEPPAAPTPAVSAPPSPGAQATVAVPETTASPGAVGTPAAAASGTPVAKPTYAPLSATTIMLAPGRWASFS